MVLSSSTRSLDTFFDFLGRIDNRWCRFWTVRKPAEKYNANRREPDELHDADSRTNRDNISFRFELFDRIAAKRASEATS